MAMKSLVLIVALFGVNGTLQAQCSIVAKMTNLRNDKGVCRVCLFDRPEAFNEKGGSPLRCVVAPVRDRTAEATFANLAPGTYAVFVFHDANNNERFDTNFLGIPKEGYGASRNNLPFAAAPAYNSNKITIADRTITTLHIRLRNL
ncbi:DUF2141 domain-containing protein [Flaviaesturariibacter flavus]|uniref:DUF2141 domain-containing protein n=1 Tax=Flaviaesturariibacter flavus TaxID=2502780 RepID=A0A4R1BAY1_9BACT|nr:DUF2141 domain-containing protein [Flaviaesturariibacter flavus]TCJ14113.1 DUF2141 domain-containing protein [Flaviaesturariibacter flavus]